MSAATSGETPLHYVALMSMDDDLEESAESFWAAVAEADASETEQERAARLALDEELDRMMDQLG
jgi:hypothetical protein